MKLSISYDTRARGVAEGLQVKEPLICSERNMVEEAR